MRRVLIFAALFPFLMGIPFLGLASTGSFGEYVIFVYKVMIIPALLLAAVDFLLRKHSQWQGIACGIGGAAAAVLSVSIALGGIIDMVAVVSGLMGALAGTLCWMAAQGITALQGKTEPQSSQGTQQ